MVERRQFLRHLHLPMQNRWKMRSRMSSVTTVPTTLPSSSIASLRSKATSSSPPPSRRVRDAEPRARRRADAVPAPRPCWPASPSASRRAQAGDGDAQLVEPHSGLRAGENAARLGPPRAGRGRTWSRPGYRRAGAGARRGCQGFGGRAEQDEVGPAGLIGRSVWAWARKGLGQFRFRPCRRVRRHPPHSKRREVVAGRAGLGRDDRLVASTRALKSRLLPALGGPSARPGDRRPVAPVETRAVPRDSVRRSQAPRPARSGPADRRRAHRRSRGSPRGGPPGRAAGREGPGAVRREPASCRSAASSWAELWASITPSTASARVRSIRPHRNARRVNSPG